MNKNKNIFNDMHEKMTPSREAEQELFARAAAIERGEGDPSADTETFGGIIMNRTVRENTHETEMNTVRSRRGGIIAAAAALALVLGIGGYAALGGRGLDMDDVSSTSPAASQSEAEETKTVTAPGEADYHKLTEEEAIEKAAELLDLPVSKIIVETKFVQEDHGIEFYELECKVDDQRVAFTIPTGYKTVTDEEPDVFMTETTAGQALTDAGIAHDGFESLAVFEMKDIMPGEGQDEGGWFIMFNAGGKIYQYMIDDTGKIVSRYCESSDKRCNLIAILFDINYEEVKAEDIKEESVEYDYGIEFSNFNYTYKGKEYHISIPTGNRMEPEEAQDLFMTETVSGMALEDAGVAHSGFEILAVCEDKFTRTGKYVSPDGKAEDKNAELSGWRVIFLAGGKTYTYCIADTGEIVQKESVEQMPEFTRNYDSDLNETAEQKTEVPKNFSDLIAPLLGVNADEIKAGDIKENSVEFDYGIEFSELSCPYKGKEYHITIPTGERREPEDEQDFFMTETAAGMALTDAGVAHDEFAALCSFEADDSKKNGWKIVFEADGMIYTYAISDMGEITSKKVYLPGTETYLTDTDVAEYEARRMAIADAGYKLADANSFGSVRGTDTDGVDGWTFDFNAGGKEHRYVVEWNASAKDKDGRYTIVSKS